MENHPQQLELSTSQHITAIPNISAIEPSDRAARYTADHHCSTELVTSITHFDLNISQSTSSLHDKALWQSRISSAYAARLTRSRSCARRITAITQKPNPMS